MKHFTPYLHFDANCEAAFNYYAKVFGGKVTHLMRYDEAPGMEKMMTPALAKQIIHARVEVGGNTLMASDAAPGRYSKPQGFTVAVGVETAAEAERIFGALADNGTITLPMAETFFAERFGQCTDQFGTPWMILCEKRMS